MEDEAVGLFGEEDELSLLEMLDHVLDHGLVVAGEITISVADVDLIFVGLNVLLGSVETINRTLGARAGGPATAGREPGPQSRAALHPGENAGAEEG